MEAIINFIKEALKGKKMSASWIVTLAVAIGGLAWVGAFAYQEYETIKLKIAYLEKKAHTKTTTTPHYNDSALSARVVANAGAIIQLKEYTSGLDDIYDDLGEASRSLTTLQEYTSGISDMEDVLSEASGSIISLQEHTSGLDDLYDDLSQASGSIIILQERMTTQEGNNNNSNSDIADLQDGVNENINFITAIQAQLKALEKDVEQTESAVNNSVNPLTM
jgi:uncharacterized protein YfcZ (UPF0381/DUF406 family)